MGPPRLLLFDHDYRHAGELGDTKRGLARPHDQDAGKRAMAYVPFWAGLPDGEPEPES
jgi:hypothetical protein